MTVEAAIEPAAAPSIRPTATRVLLVTAVYVTAVIAAAIYPLVSPLRYAGLITVEGQLVSVLNGAVWLAVLLIVFVRQPDGRLWKLIFVWSLASRIYAFSYVPDSLVWSIARPLEILAIAAYVHLAIAYPTGYLRSRFDRGVVLYVYALLVGQALLAHPVLGGHGRLRAGLRPQRLRGLAERGDLRGHHERDHGDRRRDGRCR